MNDGAMHGDGWIQPDDEELIESVISHEGGKEVITGTWSKVL